MQKKISPRQIAFPLRLGAELQDQRATLAIGDPMRTDGGAHGQQFLHQHEAAEGVEITAAVLLRQGRADPAALGHFAAECRVEGQP